MKNPLASKPQAAVQTGAGINSPVTTGAAFTPASVPTGAAFGRIVIRTGAAF
jgi:hypothetical protein